MPSYEEDRLERQVRDLSDRILRLRSGFKSVITPVRMNVYEIHLNDVLFSNNEEVLELLKEVDNRTAIQSSKKKTGS